MNNLQRKIYSHLTENKKIFNRQAENFKNYQEKNNLLAFTLQWGKCM